MRLGLLFAAYALGSTCPTSVVFRDVSTATEVSTVPGLLPLNLERLPLGNASNDTNSTECRFMSFDEWKKQKQNDTLDSPKANVSVVSIAQPEEGRVYKDKFNYASSDCAATVVKTNSYARGASAILQENKDTYLLNQCSVANKFVVIELCQDILVESVVVGNFEFFSSMFKDLRISVSDRFPEVKWTTLGEFQAENIRDVQVFRIQNPQIWARYLKIEILSHYGNEFYCPLSLVRVHGKTMMEEFKEEPPVEDPPVRQDDECRVSLPHLRLNEFLQDINATCAAPFTQQGGDIQESIYKNIMKRLSLLEQNASLSLLYIEEQSKLLSTAFTSLESRQSANLATLIDSFNASFSSHLAHFRRSYSTMHQEYANLRLVQEDHIRAMMAQVRRKAAEDVSFYKILTVVNMGLVVYLCVYVRRGGVRRRRVFNVRRRRAFGYARR